MKLRLAFDPDFAPLTFLEKGQAAGRALDIVRRACARAEITVDFVVIPLTAQARVTCEGLALRNLDGFACMALTSTRRTDFRFSVPYLPGRAGYFSRRGRQTIEPACLEHLSVATPRSGPLFPLLSRRPHGPRVVPTTGYRESLSCVWQGEADAAALNAEVGWFLAEELYPQGFTSVAASFPELLGLAVALFPEVKEADTLLARLNPSLAAERPITAPGAYGP